MENISQFYHELRRKVRDASNWKLLKVYKNRAEKRYRELSMPHIDRKIKAVAEKEYAETLRMIKKVKNKIV